ncbi:hypothetical protein PVOR_03290 [Paenibacillus vortex V453]|uniref:Uncharacterized protein n=1 Tax=Paenibacillus vortex V453 TaxID=715225 RepID=A0A2R9T156_9BACL|nr:hypothetical protein PVOR_03290 [Paenibacillus vortex V453]
MADRLLEGASVLALSFVIEPASSKGTLGAGVSSR